MKTAMQELIDYVDSIWSNEGWEETIKEKAKELLEKEKNQMIDFAMQMRKIDCSKTGTDILFDEAEQYYNKTYNQKN